MSKKNRHVTLEESEKILQSLVEKEQFINFSQHRAFPHHGFGEGVYRFSVNVISLDMLINIMEHEQIQNVYFSPTAAGPGVAMDGISMTYKVYVKYHPVKN
tara:strand:+ start:2000 stop:2302 length:303 start_codon:yes stop_codon:yes gene_type:complete